MARKGKNKRKKKKYSKKQFIEIVCSSCNICANIGKPIFCYDSLYKINPKRFSKVLKNLLNMRKHFRKSYLLADDLEVEKFSKIFCHTGICNNSYNTLCQLLPDCYDIFIAQVENKEKSMFLKPKLTQKRKVRKNRRYVCHAYPTFFSSNDDKFKATVERILHGDNIIKQDNNKEPGTKAKKLPCRETESKKP